MGYPPGFTPCKIFYGFSYRPFRSNNPLRRFQLFQSFFGIVGYISHLKMRECFLIHHLILHVSIASSLAVGSGVERYSPSNWKYFYNVLLPLNLVLAKFRFLLIFVAKHTVSFWNKMQRIIIFSDHGSTAEPDHHYNIYKFHLSPLFVLPLMNSSASQNGAMCIGCAILLMMCPCWRSWYWR